MRGAAQNERVVVTIGRDPFARADEVREIVYAGECAWCGRRGARFRYGWWRDGLNTRPEWAGGVFCGVDCYRRYHGPS